MATYLLTYSEDATWGSTNTIYFSSPMSLDDLEAEQGKNVVKLLGQYGELDPEYIVEERLYYIRKLDVLDLEFKGDE